MSMKQTIAAVSVAFGIGTAAYADVPNWTQTSYFTQPAGADMATEGLSGRLNLTTTEMTVVTDPAESFVRNPWAWWGIFDFLAAQDPEGAVPLFELDAQLFPGLSIDFFTTPVGDLVPVERGLIRKGIAERTQSFWEIIAGPGKTWAETEGDFAGWNKASFPFSLVQSSEGEAWIGLAAFHYKGSEVSDVRIQLSSDSAGGFIFWDADWNVNAWADVPASFEAGTVVDEASLQSAYADEKARLLPVRPVADLGQPAVELAASLDPATTLLTAFLSDGTLYMDPVMTPFGEHPYPQAMRVGVWSMSKSMISGIAALRLAEKYGTDFLDTKIVDYFKEGAEFAYADDASRVRWGQVTIRHALNMMTGMGPVDSDVNWAPDSLNTYQWSYSYALSDQIQHYFAQTPNPDLTGPGEKMAYIDQDMWMAALAMERFLQSKEGSDATLVGMLVDEVYDPIGADHFALGTNPTPDGALGFPYVAWGALPTVDIVAKAARLVGNGGMAEDGTQILSRTMIDALAGEAEYETAFWKLARPEGAAGVGQVPYMSGAGGNTAMIMPNGMVAIVFSRDSYNVTIPDEQRAGIAAAANTLRPF